MCDKVFRLNCTKGNKMSFKHQVFRGLCAVQKRCYLHSSSETNWSNNSVQSPTSIKMVLFGIVRSMLS